MKGKTWLLKLKSSLPPATQSSPAANKVLPPRPNFTLHLHIGQWAQSNGSNLLVPAEAGEPPFTFLGHIISKAKNRGKRDKSVEWRIFYWIDEQQLLIWSPNKSNRVGGKKMHQTVWYLDKKTSLSKPSTAARAHVSLLYKKDKDIFLIILECHWQTLAADIANAIYRFITHQLFPSLHRKADWLYFDNRFYCS